MTSTRRTFLKRSFSFSAAIALGGAVPRALTAGPAPAPRPGKLGGVSHVLAFGDYGTKKDDLPRQRAVSEAMKRYLGANQIRPDGMLMLGDNFYGGLGGRGVASARWRWNVEDMYPADVFDCPMYAVLGNHDYSGEWFQGCVNAQLAYARQASRPRWTLPHKWYRFDLGPGEKPLATALVIDTNYVYGNPGWLSKDERKRQARWLAAELDKPREAPWLFVLGHHPLFSDGRHGDNARLIADFDPLLRRHKADLYLCGHDHDLQHLEFKGHPTSFVVSGAGGARARQVQRRGRGLFGRAVYGFTHLELRPDRFALRHVDANGAVLHAFTKTRGGRVTVL